jgi:hypothetical protein
LSTLLLAAPSLISLPTLSTFLPLMATPLAKARKGKGLPVTAWCLRHEKDYLRSGPL